MNNYITDSLTSAQNEAFTRFIDREIGTEWEVDQHDENEFTVTVFDLSTSELKKVREFEKGI